MATQRDDDRTARETGGSWALPRPVEMDTLSPDALRDILDRNAADDREIEGTVRDILQAVRELGDEGVQQHTERFDRVRPDRLILGKDDFALALSDLDPALRRAMDRAVRNLRKVAEKSRPPARVEIEVEPGLRITEHAVPLASVGCYVPGGKAAYPSSVLMAVVPAKVAGVDEVVVASPPGPDGRPPKEVLAACALAGADACLVAGGAQAIAALAFGIDALDPVDKIVGPGNRYVTTAKRLVYGGVDIDSPAGPTEVVIVADDSVDPHWVASDLVAQAEHAPDARCILVTTDRAFAEAVADALTTVVASTPRQEVVAEALGRHGLILLAPDDERLAAFVRRYAPEHLQLMTEDATRYRSSMSTAAATFVGPYAPVPVGDYLTGANHVLPTGGAARWASPLSVHSFLVRRVEEHLTAEAAAGLVDDLAVFAGAEGLPGHAISMRARAGPMRRFRDAKTTDPKPGEDVS